MIPSTKMAEPPDLPDLSWRAIGLDDLPALADLAAACYRRDGGIAFLNTPDNLARRYFPNAPGATTGAFAGERLVACATVHVEQEEDTERALIAGQVEPEWRGKGLGPYLMRWSEAQAGALFAAAPEKGRLLQIATETLTDAADRLYRAHGYEQAMEEWVLRRDLRLPLPDRPFPPGVTLRSWEPALARHFYQAYHASFRDRPGFPGWSAAEWIRWTADDNLRPAWPLLARAEGEPVGFVTAGVEHQVAFIMQIGVIPEQRRRGLASALMVEAMRRMQAAGEKATELTVARNNPGAVAAYRRLGFVTKGRRARYRRRAGL